MDLYISKPGVMSSAGNNIDQLWASVISGNQSGIKKVKACNGEDFFAARIEEKTLSPSSAIYDMKIMRIEDAALKQISDDVNAAIKKYGCERLAVCVGSCDNGTQFSVEGHRSFFSDGKFPNNYTLEIQGADYVATFAAQKFGIKGPVNAFSTACSSSAGAIIKAAEMIISGIVDAALVGGVDIASDTTLIGFNSLEAISFEITNPFSKNRHGITLGDGAAFFLLTKEVLSQDSIKLLGWGESADAYHATSPDPNGEGAKKAIQKALKSASLLERDIDYINLHGTGTKFNDSMEAKAIDSIFGSKEIKVPVSTTKPITGHTLGAAAALELSICWKTLVENSHKKVDNFKLPLQVWDGKQDEKLPFLNIVSKTKGVSKENLVQKKEINICLSNSFAFGGANACLVIGR